MAHGARLTKGKMAIATVLAAASLAACGQQASTQKPPEPGDKAVARVNGQTVWASDVKREAVADGLIGQGDPLDVSSDLFRQELDIVLDTKVLSAEALKRHLDKDPAAQRRIAAARERVLEDLLVESMLDKTVNEQTERALYDDYLKSAPPSEEIHLHEIVLGAEPEAEQVKKLIAGGAAFEALAMERSKDDASRFKGGDLGAMTTDTLPEPLAAAIKDAKAGQIVGPVKLDEGWALIRVDERHPEPPPTFDQAKPILIHEITDSQVKDLILTLRNKAKIEMLVAPPPDVPGAPTEPASAPPERPGAPPVAAPAAPAANDTNQAGEGTD
jgi:peptidyl-prolyl cis-trans isomerase C